MAECHLPKVEVAGSIPVSRSKHYLIAADEVGRGSLAGPLCVGAVLVPTDLPRLEGMDDSKQVAPRARERAVGRLQATAAVLATISLVEAAGIDQDGMSACLHQAFRAAIQALIDLGVTADISRSEG